MKDVILLIVDQLSPETRRGLLTLTAISIIALVLLFLFGFVVSMIWYRIIVTQIDLPSWVLILGFVIIGGIKRIAKVTEKLVPTMAIVYFLGALAVIIYNYENIIPSLYAIFHDVLEIY